MITLVTPATTGALTTEDKARTELRLNSSEQIVDLLELIYKASTACASWCNRPEGFGRATWRQTQRLSASRDYLMLERDILPEITTLTVDGVEVDADDYELDGCGIYRLSDDERTSWSGKVVVTYDAGYTLLTDTPHDLERACQITLAAMHGMRGRDPAERSRDDSLVQVAYRAEAVPLEAQQLLAPYRRFAM